MNCRMSAGLQDRLDAALITICTNCMRGFALLFSYFRNVSEKSTIQVLKFISLLLTFPCFEAAQFFFKLIYFVNRRRIARLGGDDLFPELRDGRISIDRVVHILQRLRDVKHRLESAQTCDSFANHAALLKERASAIANSERA